MKDDREIREMLRSALRPYVERLRDPDVVESVDARTAASIVKMLLETCEAIEDEPCAQGETPGRREILEMLREVSREREQGEPGDETPTSADRRRCPEADG